MNKKHFYYSGKTGIGYTKGFEKKKLAKYSVNIGNICEFGCSFCYVPSVTRKQKTVRSIIDQGYEVGEFSSYRYKDNVLRTVAKDLRKFEPDDDSMVIFCTTCDPCANSEHADTSVEAIKLVMEKSNLQVRVLSKSILIKIMAQKLSMHKDRVTYSLSTGTANDKISAAIEAHASPIGKRIEALHWLQGHNFRTYGMICPVLPSEVENVETLIDNVRPEKCEHVWVEAINVRGKSLARTYEKLVDAGLNDHAEKLKKVMGNNDSWVKYSKALFTRIQAEMKKRGELEKLRFLQYISRLPEEEKRFFENAEGAVCL
jgi:DNA repair photolyase